MGRKSLVAVLTSYNRREQTLTCLEHFFRSAAAAPQVDVRAVLVDDGSNDGTASAVADRFRSVRIIHGDGNLYWNMGMRLALEEVAKCLPDFLLLLNDDTILNESAIEAILAAYETANPNSIIVGSVRDAGTGAWTYGGRRRKHWWHPIKTRLLVPDENSLIRCDTFNGNVVLVPAGVFRTVGNLSPFYRHKMGDYDYGFRAAKMGVACVVAPGAYGTCSRNPRTPMSPLHASVVEDFRDFMSNPKRLPFQERLTYFRAHGGMFWWIFFPIPYLRFWPSRLLLAAVTHFSARPKWPTSSE